MTSLTFFKTNVNKGIGLILLISFLFSCSTSNQVVSNKLIQKRKYNKGWHVNSNQDFTKKRKSSEARTESVAQEMVQADSVHDTYTYVEENSASQSSLAENTNYEQVAEKAEVVKQKKIKSFVSDKILPVFSNLSREYSVNPSRQMEPVFQQESEPILSDRAVRILLAILAIIVLCFTFIAPLAVWIALGRCEALRISWMFYLALLLSVLLLIFGTLFLVSGLSAGTNVAGIIIFLIIMSIISGALSVVSFVHALISIIRGY